MHVLDSILPRYNSMFEIGYTMMKVINLMHALNRLLKQANLLLEVPNILPTHHTWKLLIEMGILNL